MVIDKDLESKKDIVIDKDLGKRSVNWSAHKRSRLKLKRKC